MSDVSRMWIAQSPDGITVFGAKPTPDSEWGWDDETQTELPINIHPDADAVAVRQFEIKPIGPPLIHCPLCNALGEVHSGEAKDWRECPKCKGRGIVCEEGGG